MVDNIKYRIDTSGISIYIDGEKNVEKTLWAYALNRPFFALSKANLNELRRMIHEGLSAQLNNRRR